MADKKLRLAFMGTPDFALPTLKKLTAAGHEIAMIWTKPPRQSGRGLKSQMGAVADYARAHKLPLRQASSLRAPEEVKLFRDLHLDASITAAFGLILPKEFLSIPPLGCLNLHPSLLPRWRGAAPIERAIMAGDRTTGATIMLMAQGVDSGDILAQQDIPIGGMNAGQLRPRLAEIGAALMAATLRDFAAGKIKPQAQDESQMVMAPRLTAADEKINWQSEASKILCQIRALSPRPGAWFSVKRKGRLIRIRLLEAACAQDNQQAAGGTILDADKAIISCGKGALRLLKLQREGKKIMDVETFLLGFALHDVQLG